MAYATPSRRSAAHKAIIARKTEGMCRSVYCKAPAVEGRRRCARHGKPRPYRYVRKGPSLRHGGCHCGDPHGIEGCIPREPYPPLRIEDYMSSGYSRLHSEVPDLNGIDSVSRLIRKSKLGGKAGSPWTLRKKAIDNPRGPSDSRHRE